MSDKILISEDGDEIDLPASVAEAVKQAVKDLFDPALDDLEEPVGLASGDTSISGKFVIDDDEIDDEDVNEVR